MDFEKPMDCLLFLAIALAVTFAASVIYSFTEINLSEYAVIDSCLANTEFLNTTYVKEYSSSLHETSTGKRIDHGNYYRLIRIYDQYKDYMNHKNEYDTKTKVLSR